VPLVASLGALLGVMYGGVTWHLTAIAWGRLPVCVGSDEVRPPRCWWRGGGNTAQLLVGIPKNVVWCREGRRLLCIVHAAFGCLHP
jgi:hypothetical protein